MRLLAVLALLSAALAGCSGDTHAALPPVTCPDGTVLDPETLAHHHEAAFDPAVACPVPPSLAVTGLAANVTAHVPVAFGWAVDPGTTQHAHAMLTAVRISTTPADPAALAGPDTFGTELAKREHQDVPETVEFPVTHTFAEPGTYYLRAYAVISGVDHWSNETIVEVAFAAPTGTTITATKQAGLVAGAFAADASALRIGDALLVRNEDVVAHTFTWNEKPPAAGLADTFEVAAMAEGEPFVLVVPGTYVLATDDRANVPPLTFTVSA